MTNNFTPNELPKFTAAICCGTSTKNGSAFGASKKAGGACKIDGAAHCKCRLAHQSSRPNFFSTETFHQNAENAPNAHGVAVRWWSLVKKHAACCTLNTAPTGLPTAAHRILCQVKNGSWDIVLHKITLIWCLQTDKIWY